MLVCFHYMFPAQIARFSWHVSLDIAHISGLDLGHRFSSL